MRDLWKILEAIKEKKHMIRMAMFPGGNINVAIYDSEKQMEQKMYDAHSLPEMEEMLKRDWGHLVAPSPMPSFPRPPGV